MTLGFAPEKIEHWPLSRLQPYARNAKTHGPDQVAHIAASIAEFGWTVPVRNLHGREHRAQLHAATGVERFRGGVRPSPSQ